MDAPETGPAKDNETPRRSHWLPWCISIVAFVAFYVLSIGPAIYVLPPRALNLIYSPLTYVEVHCPPLDRFMVWYMERVWKCGTWV